MEGTEREESVCQKCSPLACGSNWMLSVMKREEVFVPGSQEEGRELFFSGVERRSKCLLYINPCLCLSSDPISIFFSHCEKLGFHTLSLPNGVLKAVRMQRQVLRVCWSCFICSMCRVKIFPFFWVNQCRRALSKLHFFFLRSSHGVRPSLLSLCFLISLHY